MLGKASMDEFAMGSSNQTSAFAKTRNPYDTSCVPGGSSGGSAAAVSAGLCAAALGSDTGGSIRQPASFCGVTGLKPTYGRVSRYGLVAFASSLDQIGPIARCARDCGTVLSAIAGQDPHDATSAPQSVPDFNEKVGKSLKGLKIALPKEFSGTLWMMRSRKRFWLLPGNINPWGRNWWIVPFPPSSMRLPHTT